MIGQNYQSKKLAIKEGHNLKKYIHKNPQDFDKLVLQLKRIRRLMTDPFWGHFFREGYSPVAARLLGGKEVLQRKVRSRENLNIHPWHQCTSVKMV